MTLVPTACQERISAPGHAVGAKTVHLVNGTSHIKDGASRALSSVLATLLNSWCLLHESVFALDSKCLRNRNIGFLNLALAPGLP